MLCTYVRDLMLGNVGGEALWTATTIGTNLIKNIDFVDSKRLNAFLLSS